MDVRIVEHHDVRLRADLGAQTVEKGNHIFLPCWSFDSSPHQCVVLIERTEHIHPLSVRLRRNRMRLSARCPNIGERWIWAEAEFVKKEQATQPLLSGFD